MVRQGVDLPRDLNGAEFGRYRKLPDRPATMIETMRDAESRKRKIRLGRRRSTT